MRLFLLTFCFTGAITASTAWADEPLTGGTGTPGHARFEPSPAHAYLVARSRAEKEHRDSIVKYYDWMGYDISRPTVNAVGFFLAPPPVRTRRIYSYPGYW